MRKRLAACLVLLGAAGIAQRTYTLPDPLRTASGAKVTLAEWKATRRAEILDLFRKHVYGRSPDRPRDLRFKVAEQDTAALGGKATRREVDITIGNAGRDFTFRLTLYLPNAAKKPVPVFLLLNHRGTVASQVNLPFFPVDQILARGYAAAGISVLQLAPDNKTTWRNGILNFYDGPDERSTDAWRGIAAWAWGGQRALDYLETDKDVDAKRVAVVGHSRGGKTALWCAAQDERFAMAVSSCSGESGAALARRVEGETISKINEGFPYWFATNYKAFNGKEDDLPVDQHELLALIAPRLLYVSSSETDAWADPLGEFLSTVHATPVFRLYGVKGMETDRMPGLSQPIHAGNIAYHIKPGGHAVIEYDWQRYMDFFDARRPR
jgi:pimeloyl-ACP methyl ester carboxylesterase